MKYYIVLFKDSGYYVSYKDKISDNYSENFIEAKRYKSIGSVLYRIGIDYKNFHSANILKEIEFLIKNSKKIQRRNKLNKLNNVITDDNGIKLIDFFENASVEIVEIKNNSIVNLGSANLEIYDFLKKENDKFLAKQKNNFKKLDPFLTEKDKKLLSSETKNATQEDIDDFLNSF